MSRWTIEGDWDRDGAVCVRRAFTAEQVGWARDAIDENLADLSPRAKRASADSDGAFIEDFCNWTRLPAMERFIRESPGAEIAAELTGSRLDPPLPRPRAGQGARHEAAHAVASGPAVLQRRRRAERQHVVPRRPGRSLGDAGVHRRHPPRALVHAAHVPRRPGQVVPRRQPRRAARLRRRSRPLAGDRLGARAGRRGVLQHAHRPRLGWRVRHRIAGACCRCGSSATTWCTRRGRGPPRRRSTASTPSWPTGCRWTIRCSHCCGAVTRTLSCHDGPDDPVDRPSGAARAWPSTCRSTTSPARRSRV